MRKWSTVVYGYYGLDRTIKVQTFHIDQGVVSVTKREIGREGGREVKRRREGGREGVKRRKGGRE